MEPFQDDPPLLEGFRRGDATALAKVYELTVRDVHRYLHGQLARTGRSELAQSAAIADMLQEVFVRAFSERARQGFRGPLFLPYVTRIARNYLVDVLRKGSQEVLLDHAVLSDAAAVQSARRDLQLLERLARYIDGLAFPLREVFEQRFVRGSSQEVARSALGITRRALRTREARLRREVRQALLRDDLAASKSVRRD